MTMTVDNFAAQEEGSVKRLYEDVNVAEDYLKQRFGHAWGRLLHSKQVNAVNRAINEARAAHVLEIAPGPARLATELSHVREGLMIDNSAPMLAIAQRRLQAAGVAHLWNLQKANAFELENLGKTFSFVFTFRFIRHFREEDRARLYRSIARCLLPAGILIFDVVNKTVRQEVDSRSPERPEGELNVFDQTYLAKSFKEEMNKYGFRVLQLQPVVKHFFLQSWISNRLGYRFPSLADGMVRILERVPSKKPLEWIALCEKVR